MATFSAVPTMRSGFYRVFTGNLQARLNSPDGTRNALVQVVFISSPVHELPAG
jgi:hypothetical protein